MIIEMVGYLGSALVIVSMLMTSVVKLRVINTVGSVIFCGYALCIHSYPTAAMQLCLIIINLVNLYKLTNTKKEYSAIPVKTDDGFLTHFLKANQEDIKNYFPDFLAPADDDIILLINCVQTPAGIFIASKDSASEKTSLNVKLDYTSPAYRDTSVGKFLYNYLKSQGIQQLSAKTEIPSHEKYLKKMGFSQSQNAGNFEKIL